MAPCRVLIVEDDQSIRNLLSVAATRWGFATESCSSGADAIERLGDGGDFDVIVLDLMMPETSGYDVILHLREKQLTVPVIVVTAVVRISSSTVSIPGSFEPSCESRSTSTGCPKRSRLPARRAAPRPSGRVPDPEAARSGVQSELRPGRRLRRSAAACMIRP